LIKKVYALIHLLFTPPFGGAESASQQGGAGCDYHQFTNFSLHIRPKSNIQDPLYVVMYELARKLKISIPAVSKSVIRGEKLAKARQYALIE